MAESSSLLDENNIFTAGRLTVETHDIRKFSQEFRKSEYFFTLYFAFRLFQFKNIKTIKKLTDDFIVRSIIIPYVNFPTLTSCS